MLKRYWRGFSPLPLPPALPTLFGWLWRRNGINVYVTS
jgi:hypothetical protein